jgi:eukaryotic-like serine/threonine-protein kinase
MGEVYQARDTRLDRKVAIKVSHAQFSERFEREARAVAALNHPNICQLYDVGPDYLVMEYVDGTPIAAPDTARKLLDFAVQIADGLAAAHAAGLVHRDLKPDNILVTGAQSAHPGRVKVLDFGLAKSAAEASSEADATRTIGITDSGTTVGTVAYMSPEQARGVTNLTAQSDQFSFGLVLYELAAGKRAFVRASFAETMTAIIREDTEPLPATVPAQLRWVIERLLAKEPAERYDSTRDLYRELKQIRERYSEATSAQQIPVAETGPAPVPGKKPRVLWGIGLAAAGLVAGLAVAALLTHPAQADLSAYKFTPISREEATEMYPAWSPDGKSIAYNAIIRGVLQVFTKAVGSPDAAQLTHATNDCAGPFWSPDGTAIYYGYRGGLWAVGASGGTPELVKDNAEAATLHPDGKTLVFRRGSKAWIGTLKGSEAREFWEAPHRPVVWRQFSPDGSKVAVIDAQDLWIVPYPSGTPRNVGAITAIGASWFPDNRHLVVNDSGSLILVDITDGTRRVIVRGSDPVAWPSVSPDGKRIAYTAAPSEWDVLEISVPDGRVRAMVSGGGISWLPDWAPSGTHYSFSTNRTNSFVIEDRSVADGFSRRLAEAQQGSDNTFVASPRWASDGTRFLFVQGSERRPRLAIGNSSGGSWTPLADLAQTELNTHAWSPDGQWVAFVKRVSGKQQLLKMRPAAGAAPVVLANAAPAVGELSMIQWSPTGDWIAYPSVEGISLVSPDGNTVRKLTARFLPAYSFSKDGAQVYGIIENTSGEGPQWQLDSIDVKTGAEKMLALLDLPASTANIVGFSLHPDGKRFLTSIAKRPYDIWMLEGFDQASSKTWLDRLLRR